MNQNLIQIVHFYTIIAICDAGHEGVPGEIACVPCHFGFFKEERNEYKCEECGRDQTTLDVGSANEDDCFGRSYSFSLRG